MHGTGAGVIVSAQPRGRFEEGNIVGVGIKPGTVVQIDPGVAYQSGRPSFIPYNPGADNDPTVGPLGVLLEDSPSGFSALVALQNGQRCRVYYPLPGDELNMLCEGEAGTGSANALTIGERLGIRNNTGKLIAQATPTAAAFFICNEHIDEVVDTDTLVWCTRA
jgi:hypothetical protein